MRKAFVCALVAGALLLGGLGGCATTRPDPTIPHYCHGVKIPFRDDVIEWCYWDNSGATDKVWEQLRLNDPRCREFYDWMADHGCYNY